MPSLASTLLQPMLFFARTGIGAVKNWPRVRQMSDTSRFLFHLPTGTHTEWVEANGVPCEWLRREGVAAQRTVLYLHGGGFVLGWYNSHRAMVAHFAGQASADILAVDYRLAPEHPFPAALEDCVAAYRWLIERVPPEQVVIMGDSAGASLTLTTLIALRDAGHPLPACGVAISPVCDFEMKGATMTSVYDPLVPPKAARRMVDAYRGDADPHDPHLAPLHADFTGLPPLLIHAGEREALRSDAERVAEKAAAHGVDVRLTVWEGLWHVHHLFTPFLPEAREALDECAAFIAART